MSGLPVISAVTPSAGPVTGGQVVTVTGSGFVAGMTATIRRYRGDAVEHHGELIQLHDPGGDRRVRPGPGDQPCGGERAHVGRRIHLQRAGQLRPGDAVPDPGHALRALRDPHVWRARGGPDAHPPDHRVHGCAHRRVGARQRDRGGAQRGRRERLSVEPAHRLSERDRTTTGLEPQLQRPREHRQPGHGRARPERRVRQPA